MWVWLTVVSLPLRLEALLLHSAADLIVLLGSADRNWSLLLEGRDSSFLETCSHRNAKRFFHLRSLVSTVTNTASSVVLQSAT